MQQYTNCKRRKEFIPIYLFCFVYIIVQQALVKPNVNGLEDDDTQIPPEEPTNLDYSSPWHDTFVANKEIIRHNLHILHPSMQTVLRMCNMTLGNMLLLDCATLK